MTETQIKKFDGKFVKVSIATLPFNIPKNIAGMASCPLAIGANGKRHFNLVIVSWNGAREIILWGQFSRILSIEELDNGKNKNE